ncbi:MAG: hypothetical protein HQL74_15250 [Magnetococcales bacterium]|nr:hypothetical protein [Magnetococcales bacterium]
MAAIKFRHFIQPDILTSIDPGRLLLLLSPYRAYLSKRGLSFPAFPYSSIHCAKLSAILADPDEHVPSRMVDALYFINEMSNINTVEGLIAAARAAHPDMEFSIEASNADVVVQIWLADPDLVAKKHAASMINKPRSFEYYSSGDAQPQPLSIPHSTVIQAMESAMDDWFEKNRRGRNCRIIVADHGDKISFLIRHGMPMQREGTINNGESSSLCYRPEVYDVVFYDRTLGELGIRASGTKGEKRLYRETIGFHLFKNQNHFPEHQKFTLAPLAIDGANALVCSDIDGLERVVLTAYQNRLNEGYNGYNLYTADDVFLSMLEKQRSMPPASDLTMAVFSMKLAGVKNPRSLTIKLPNHAMYHRDGDSVVIDQWLAKRGFIHTPER